MAQSKPTGTKSSDSMALERYIFFLTEIEQSCVYICVLGRKMGKGWREDMLVVSKQ
jgi:hypothetical protein